MQKHFNFSPEFIAYLKGEREQPPPNPVGRLKPELGNPLPGNWEACWNALNKGEHCPMCAVGCIDHFVIEVDDGLVYVQFECDNCGCYSGYAN